MAPVAFIGTTALTRTAIVPPIPPDEVRYRWAVAAYLVLAVVIMWRRDRIPLGATVRTVAAFLAGAVLVVGAVRLVNGANGADGVNGMRTWTDLVVGNEPGLRAVTVAVESVPRPADPSQRLPLSFVKITAAGYLGAVHDVGSPNDGYRFTHRAGHQDQVTFADHYLIEQSRTRVAPLPPGSNCAAEPVDTAPAGSSVLVDTRRASQPGALRIARFGSLVDAPTVPLPRSTVGIIDLPADPPHVDGRAISYRFAAPAGVSLRLCS